MPPPSSCPRVYFAGPDVFRPDAAEHFEKLAQVCIRLGLAAVPPVDTSAARRNSARRIYEENIGLLRSAHGVIANLQPFRGLEPDSGTAFEVGVAMALGLPVVAYGVPAESYLQRMREMQLVTLDDDGVPCDPSGLAVEDFGLPVNLMLACATTFAPTATQALKVLAESLRR